MNSRVYPQDQYCITHECWEDVTYLDLDACYFIDGCIFTTSIPPEDQPISYGYFDAPSPDELAEMDQSAASLLADILQSEKVS